MSAAVAWAVGLVGFVLFAVSGPENAGSDLLSGGALLSLYVGAAVAAFAGAAIRRHESRGWLLLATAVAGYGVSAFVYAVDPGVASNFPSAADVGLFLYYPLGIAALATVIRARFRWFSVVMWLDACIVAAAVAAIAVIVLRAELPAQLDAITIGQLAYAVGDLIFVGLLIAVYLMAGRHSTPAMRMVFGGAVLTAAADVVYTTRIADGIAMPGTFTSVAWPAGILALGLAPALRITRIDQPSFDPELRTIPLLAAAVCLPVVAASTTAHHPIALFIASLALALVIVRLYISLRRNSTLLARVSRLGRERDAILNAAGDGILHVDANGRISFVNRVGAAVLDWAEDELVGLPVVAALHPPRMRDDEDAALKSEILRAIADCTTTRVADDVFCRRDGTRVPVAYVSAPIVDRGRPLGAVCVFTDITERKRVEAERDDLLAQVQMLACTDPLTGIPNRRSWDDQLARALARARRQRQPLTVALLDLDRFKDFNDTHGHQRGDELLADAAAAWRGALRRDDFIARYGGEEFGVLLPNCTADEAEQALERLRAVTPGGQTFSAGVVTWNGEDDTDGIVARADAQLYAAKEAGRDAVFFG